MKKLSFFLLTVFLACIFSATAFAYRDGTMSTTRPDSFKIIAGTDNPGGMNKKKESQPASVSSGKSRKKISNKELEALYVEFQKFWYVNDPDDLQDRFEEFLKTKNVDPVQLEDYDEFMEAWVDNYDDDPDFDDIESYIWNSDEPEDPDWDDEEALERMLEEYPEGTLDPGNINDLEEIIDEGSDW